MWLLSTDRAELTYFKGSDEAKLRGGYAILSHVWHGQELSFQEVQALRTQTATSTDDVPRSRVPPKIRECCMLAEKHGFHWVWIDTCCIDKTSSSELSEAINSMFRWYSDAAVCYAYLYDVSSMKIRPGSPFYKSQWFTRGWTLQELIAPRSLLFVMNDWTILGTRTQLAKHVEQITSVGIDILLHRRELGQVSIAQRMHWASRRCTTRVEDEAYCLMGIFGVNMPTVYGEGRAAFHRLQEEIMKISSDQTLFAWGDEIEIDHVPSWTNSYGFTLLKDDLTSSSSACFLLASSPERFKYNGGYEAVDAMKVADQSSLWSPPAGLLEFKATTQPLSRTDEPVGEGKVSELTLTSLGMRWTLPIVKLRYPGDESGVYVAVLGCRSTSTDAVMGLLLSPVSDFLQYQTYHDFYAVHAFVGRYRLVSFNALQTINGNGTADSSNTISAHTHAVHGPLGSRRLNCERITWVTIHVLHRPLAHMHSNFDSGIARDRSHPGWNYFVYQFSNWSIMELQRMGFRPKNLPRGAHVFSPVTFCSITAPEEGFTIALGRCLAPIFDNPRAQDKPRLCFVPSAGLSFRSRRLDSPDPTGPSYGKAEAATAAFYNCPGSHIEPDQTWTRRFGDRKRMVELTFHLHRQNPSDSASSLKLLVDIHLAGKVYMALYNQKRDTRTGIDLHSREHSEEKHSSGSIELSRSMHTLQDDSPNEVRIRAATPVLLSEERPNP